MSDFTLDPGKFEIRSLDGDRPAGVDNSKVAFQTVRLNVPVTTWTFTQVGPGVFKFIINGYSHVGVVDDKVTASIYPEHEEAWRVNRIEALKAYTIELARDPGRVWTVSPEFSPTPEVVVTQVGTPDIPPTQLWRFVRVED